MFLSSSRERAAEAIEDLTEDRTVGQNALGGWRLFHYLRGGGLRTFASSSRRFLNERRQERFLVFSAVFFAIWLAIMFI